MFGYDNLENHMRTNFALMQHHGYSLTELEGMIVWERMVYVTLLQAYLKEEKDRQRLDQLTKK